jgi:hypothetical protein
MGNSSIDSGLIQFVSRELSGGVIENASSNIYVPRYVEASPVPSAGTGMVSTRLRPFRFA